MLRRNVVFVLLALVAAAVCVRLGFWQLSRLETRRERNALAAARLSEPPVPPAALPSDVARARLRRVTLSGVYDYPHEIVLTNRSRSGSPGVYIVTPLLPTGSDTAVLVTRGWVYSPDGTTVDLDRWREADTATVTGFIEAFPPTEAGRGSASVPGRPGTFRRLDRDEVEHLTGYPVAHFRVVHLDDGSTEGDSVPARLTPPPLDEGPHLSYAFQWFAFAAVAVIGAAVFVRDQRRERRWSP